MQCETVHIFHIAGLTNWADMLTKPLPVSQHRGHRDNVLGANIVVPQRCIGSGGGVKPDGFSAATSAAARFCVQTNPSQTDDETVRLARATALLELASAD